MHVASKNNVYILLYMLDNIYFIIDVRQCISYYVCYLSYEFMSCELFKFIFI